MARPNDGRIPHGLNEDVQVLGRVVFQFEQRADFALRLDIVQNTQCKERSETLTVRWALP